MKIAHLTDLHIAEEGEAPYGVDVRRCFERVVADIEAARPDLLVIGGDLCYRDGFAPTYAWIRTRLETLAAPVLAVPGNHDDTRLLAAAFDLGDGLQGEHLYFRRELDGLPAFFLDTAAARVSETQLQWLERELSAVAGRRALLFMHHPPAECGVYYMDLKYPLENREEFARRLEATDKEFTIFCGHYHVDKSLRSGRMDIHITPSTFVQIDRDAAEFRIDHRRIGWRLIGIEGEEITTSVRWLPEES